MCVKAKLGKNQKDRNSSEVKELSNNNKQHTVHAWVTIRMFFHYRNNKMSFQTDITS